MANNLSSKYKTLNQSFKSKFVFRIGTGSGFFSEYNNMIFAILYCLANQLEFVLSSHNTNIFRTGWDDYFNSFCKQNNSPFHQRFNGRFNKHISSKRKLLESVYKKLTHDKLTQDLWLDFHSRDFEKQIFNIKELDLNGNLLAVSKKIIELTWSYNQTTKSIIQPIIDSLNIPQVYASAHIRRGDKINEVDHTDIDLYIEKLAQLQSSKDVFIATDDYSVIEYLKSNYDDYNFYHLTATADAGYNQHVYNNLDAGEQKKALYQLLATIEVLSNSQIFVGTFSSNIGMFLAMRMGTEKAFDVNDNEWKIW